MKLLVAFLVLSSSLFVHANNCDLYVVDSLAYKPGEKKDEKILDTDFLEALKAKGYNAIALKAAKRPITKGSILGFTSAIVDKPAFLKKGLATLKFRITDYQTKEVLYQHLHSVSCKYSNKKDSMKFEKDCMDHLKTEVDFFPECAQ